MENEQRQETPLLPRTKRYTYTWQQEGREREKERKAVRQWRAWYLRRYAKVQHRNTGVAMPANMNHGVATVMC